MTSYSDLYNTEVRGLFGNLRRNQFRREPKENPKRVPQEGPLGPAVPFGFNNSDVFDDTDTMDTLVWVPETILRVLEVKAMVSLREFFASATTVAADAGATSSSASDHTHVMFDGDFAAGAGHTSRLYVATDSSGDVGVNLSVDASGGGDMITKGSAGAHSHTVAAHTHDLEYGIFKESLPGSFDVELRVYEWDGAAWNAVSGSLTLISTQVDEVDLTDYITGPGQYKITIKSDAGAPNDGRLGCDLAGYVVGAIQP